MNGFIHLRKEIILQPFTVIAKDAEKFGLQPRHHEEDSSGTVYRQCNFLVTAKMRILNSKNKTSL